MLTDGHKRQRDLIELTRARARDPRRKRGGLLCLQATAISRLPGKKPSSSRYNFARVTGTIRPFLAAAHTHTHIQACPLARTSRAVAIVLLPLRAQMPAPVSTASSVTVRLTNKKGKSRKECNVYLVHDAAAGTTRAYLIGKYSGLTTRNFSARARARACLASRGNLVRCVSDSLRPFEN